MKNKFAIVDLKGGLGNQLFIICFANYLKNSGFKVFIDTSFYKYEQQFPREIEVDLARLDIRSIQFRNNKIFFYLNTWFEEIEHLGNYNFKILNRFTGYYQNFDYLDFNKDYLKNFLEIQDIEIQTGKSMIHIRKGDYLKLGEDLNPSYYQDAINELLKDKPDTKFDIFVDDSSFVPNENIFKNLNNVFYPKKSENSLEVFHSMLGYENYIVANSSLSIIAAHLSSSSVSKIYYPNPWWKNHDVKVSNIPSNWISIDNV